MFFSKEHFLQINLLYEDNFFLTQYGEVINGKNKNRNQIIKLLYSSMFMGQ